MCGHTLYYLGIDTSNYTTSASVADGNGRILLNLKCPLRVESGARGLRQSDALFEHTVNLPELFTRLKKELSGISAQKNDVDVSAASGSVVPENEGIALSDGEKPPYSFAAVGVSVTPRDEEGSYMPCFLAGKAAAYAVSAACGIPAYGFSHQAGHIRAALYSGSAEEISKSEFIAFHVSGGTTELLLVSPGMKIKKLGGTIDLNAGQAIDRAGVMLGLNFPCGPALERLAEGNNPAMKPKICVRGLECNLSGLENQTRVLIDKGADKCEIAAYVIDFIKLTISKLTENALSEYGELPVLYAGGVMSNQIIKEYLGGKFNAYFAKPEFSSDNAAGTALLCREKHLMETDKQSRKSF